MGCRGRQRLPPPAGGPRKTSVSPLETPLWCKRAETAFFSHSHIPHIALMRPASGLPFCKEKRQTRVFNHRWRRFGISLSRSEKNMQIFLLERAFFRQEWEGCAQK